MKDKFEKVIRITIISAGYDFLLAEKIAKACNTLHQQAMKEEKEKMLEEMLEFVKDWKEGQPKISIIRLLQHVLDTIH